MKVKDEMSLPKVGDRLMRVMTATNFGKGYSDPEPCVVVYVSKPKHYYTVQFVGSGLKESYKVPLLDERRIISQFQDDFKRAFGKKPKGVYVYESGALYPSISECARAIGVMPCTVSKHIHGQSNHVKGYHIYVLD